MMKDAICSIDMAILMYYPYLLLNLCRPSIVASQDSRRAQSIIPRMSDVEKSFLLGITDRKTHTFS